MSQFHSRRLKYRSKFEGPGETNSTSDASRPTGQTPDSALDAALRSVPLPQGLLTRLSLLAYTIPEEAADPVDWLGC